MSIAVEVIDSATGHPAAGIDVTLWRGNDAKWHELANGKTDETGGVPALAAATGGSWPAAATAPLERGRYRLRLALDPYFAGLGVTPFQSQVEVAFRVFHSGQQIRLLMMITSSSCDAQVVLAGDRPAPGPDGPG